MSLKIKFIFSLIVLALGIIALNRWYDSPATHETITSLENSRFGNIIVHGSENIHGKLVIYLRNSLPKENIQFISSLTEKGAVVTEIDFNQYSELSKKEGIEVQNNCYECAGEITRLSQVIQNRLKMKKLDKALLMAEGDTVEKFITSILEYLDSDFLTCMDTTCTIFNDFIGQDSTPPPSLPIVENIPKKIRSDYFVLFLSGDGGWANIDKEIGANLSESGIPVIGLDSLKYFWHKRNPDRITKDIESIIKTYKKKLGKEKVVLLGFSLGANMIPFVLTRLSEPDSKSVILSALLSPTKNTDFEVNFTDWLPIQSDEAGLSIGEELKNIHNPKIICIVGEEDTDSACTEPKPIDMQMFKVPGSHHFDGDYEKVSNILKDEFKKRIY